MELYSALVDALQHGDKELGEAAAYRLARIPARSADVGALTTLLSDEIDVARPAAAKSCKPTSEV